jgi:hypothetical protein
MKFTLNISLVYSPTSQISRPINPTSRGKQFNKRLTAKYLIAKFRNKSDIFSKYTPHRCDSVKIYFKNENENF